MLFVIGFLQRSLAENAEAGGGLMVAVIQLCLALGSTIGGILLDGSGYPVIFAASADLLLISALGVRRDTAALSPWVKIPLGYRSSRKQPEQLWRQRYG